MLSPTEKFLFIFLIVVCVAATANTFSMSAKIIAKGEGGLNWKDLPQRIITGLTALFSQGGIIRHRTTTSLIHYGVAYGFLFYFIVNGVDVAEGLITGFHVPDNIIGNLYKILADALGFVVLVGVLYFLLRRFAFGDETLTARDNVLLDEKARNNGIRQDSLVVGVFILMHIGFRMLAVSHLVAQEGIFDPWQPFASTLATMLGLYDNSAVMLNFGWHFSWWVAVGLVVLFLPYFPYTKHAHLFMGPFNYMTEPDRTYLGQMFTLDFDDEGLEQFGAATLFDLPQTRIVDAFACIMCNRCQEVCPAYNTGKELSPAAIEINKRYFIKENMIDLSNGSDFELPPLMGSVISESALWACTACGHCIDVCPVGNAPMLDIMEMRRNQVLMENEFPKELQSAFVGLERAGNPWQDTSDRMEWAKPLPFEVPTVQQNPDYEYLLWVGCAGAFNPDAQRTVRAVATILHEAEVSFAVLGDAETCTGDPARRAGHEALYWELALGNIETLNAAKANERHIVTSCPHCFTTIGKEYGELGGDYKVFHHTQMIADLVGKGKVKLNKDNTLEKVTFHDPCYLGRHNGIVNDPREALAQAGLTLLEMDKHGTDSFCCGAGGAQYWKEEEHGGDAVNLERYSQAEATGATTLAVGCPFCATMMHDANNQKGAPMQVKDVAEIVAEAMVQPAEQPMAAD